MFPFFPDDEKHRKGPEVGIKLKHVCFTNMTQKGRQIKLKILTYSAPWWPILISGKKMELQIPEKSFS